MTERKLDEPLDRFSLEEPFPENQLFGNSTPLVHRLGKTIRWRLSQAKPEDCEEIGVRNNQGLFLERFPRFNKAFPRGEDGRISDDKIDVARAFILSIVGTVSQFSAVFGGSPGSRRRTPYFEGSYLKALQKSFEQWGINFEDGDDYTLKNDCYESPGGKKYVHRSSLHKKFGITCVALDRILNGISSIPVQKFQSRKLRIQRGKGRAPTVLYEEEESMKAINDFLAYPATDRKSRKYVDEQGKSHAVAKYFSNLYGLSYGTTLSFLDGIDKIEGRDSYGREAVLYDEEEVTKVFQSFVSLPKVDPKTGVYTDSEGKRYFSVTYLDQTWGIEVYGSSDALKGVSFIVGRDRIGKRVNLYSEPEVIQAIKDKKLMREKHLALPQLDKDTYEYIDSGGIVYTTVTYFRRHLGFDSRIIRACLNQSTVSSITGRDTQGHIRTLYKRDQLLDSLNSYKLLSLSRSNETQALDPEPVNENTDPVPRNSKGQIRWRILARNQAALVSVIESEVKDLISQGYTVSQNSIVMYCGSGLVHAITDYYPGQLTGLKANLGIESVQKHHGYWSIERIREEARAFCLENGNLTQSLLAVENRYDLIGAVAMHYAGGLTQLKIDLGILRTQRSSSMWTAERNLEAASIPIYLEELPSELKQEILDEFLDFIKVDLDNTISLIDFAVDYIRKRAS